MIGRRVVVDDRVPQAARGLRREHPVVRVDDPIDRAVANRVRRDVDAGVVQRRDDLAVRLGWHRRISRVAGVFVRVVLVPVGVHPRRARAAAAVHEHLHAAGDEHAVAERCSRPWVRIDAREHRRIVLHATRSAP